MIKTIVPQSPILQKYIECFYRFNKESPDRFRYWAFPHYNNSIAFFKGVTFHRSDSQVVIEGNLDYGIHIEILGKYMNPVLVQYTGAVQELSIIFKPLGLNRFIRENYRSITPNFSQRYQNLKWEVLGATLFNTEDSIAKLEEFLLTQLEETKEILAIDSALALIENIELNYSVAQIAESTGYNLKSFQRHFTKQMGCSPVDYRRIVRFRNAIVSKLNSKELKSLTDISYENNYFDQSYFIKEFKRLTNHNPKIFFKEVSLVDGDKIAWEIL